MMRLIAALIITFFAIRSAAQTNCTALEEDVQVCSEFKKPSGSRITLPDVSFCVLKLYEVASVIYCVDSVRSIQIAKNGVTVYNDDDTALPEGTDGTYINLKKILVVAADLSIMPPQVVQALDQCPQTKDTYASCLCTKCVSPCLIRTFQGTAGPNLKFEPSSYTCKGTVLSSCPKTRRGLNRVVRDSQSCPGIIQSDSPGSGSGSSDGQDATSSETSDGSRSTTLRGTVSSALITTSLSASSRPLETGSPTLSTSAPPTSSLASPTSSSHATATRIMNVYHWLPLLPVIYGVPLW